MKKYLAKFENEAAYDEFKAGEDFVTPNVSWCVGEDSVKWNPYVIPHETRVIAKYNVTDTTSATKIQSAFTSNIASMEIDGVVLDTPVSAYTFDTVGEHVVKYTLIDNTTIGQYAFKNCYVLSSIAIPDSVTSFGVGAFTNCIKLSSVTIPDSITSIETETFDGCTSLSSITIPDSVTSIGMNAINYCPSLSSITIPDSVTSIGYSAFGYCKSLSSITIPDSVTSIGGCAFSNCFKLSSITIGSGVTLIEFGEFQDCYSLSSVTIPDNVTSIGNGAFERCTSLSSITYNGTQAQWASVTKGTDWNYNVPATVVHCTDGDVSL